MTDRVDLSPYNLLIATPIGDGRPEDAYNVSLDNTKQLIRHHGGKVETFKTKYVSDIALARSKLFGAFLRNEQYSHMMMIDSDQDWLPEEVVWFLLLKRDFLAAVSVKKTCPPEFAFNAIGDDGKRWALTYETDTNVAELPFVGGAFVLISRHCAERMAQSYPELQYEVDPGTTEYAVFDPIILNDGLTKRRLSEDYAFCYRWRKIGGRVEVKMDVNLGHTGSHRFSGTLLEHLTKNQPSFSGAVTVNGT